ncbi:hypothetical protein BDV41DRAFT_539555 [Aspergillus transmontanensis]|uniref:Uncharacterized protein n=1 Tax=Aspergillus transmontanensis TaxID=1034304 RepID=A0A5N6VVH9_9EURO|nr:hypothetical protein BDV41DRAFT_539555 [Aspergillus transmontanensis]
MEDSTVSIEKYQRVHIFHSQADAKACAKGLPHCFATTKRSHLRPLTFSSSQKQLSIHGLRRFDKERSSIPIPTVPEIRLPSGMTSVPQKRIYKGLGTESLPHLDIKQAKRGILSNAQNLCSGQVGVSSYSPGECCKQTFPRVDPLWSHQPTGSPSPSSSSVPGYHKLRLIPSEKARTGRSPFGCEYRRHLIHNINRP